MESAAQARISINGPDRDAKIINTTIYELIEAAGEGTDPDQDRIVVQAVTHILEAHQRPRRSLR